MNRRAQRPGSMRRRGATTEGMKLPVLSFFGTFNPRCPAWMANSRPAVSVALRCAGIAAPVSGRRGERGRSAVRVLDSRSGRCVSGVRLVDRGGCVRVAYGVAFASAVRLGVRGLFGMVLGVLWGGRVAWLGGVRSLWAFGGDFVATRLH